jgi:hypothetical protein
VICAMIFDLDEGKRLARRAVELIESAWYAIHLSRPGRNRQ